jgi:hypothetical protein
MAKAHIRIKFDNPGKEIGIDIDEDKLWELFTHTIPDIQARLQGLEAKLTISCALLFVCLAGGFSIMGALIGFK